MIAVPVPVPVPARPVATTPKKTKLNNEMEKQRGKKRDKPERNTEPKLIQ